MELYIKKAKLMPLDRYEVTDSKGNKVLDIRAELVSVGKRFRVSDASGKEKAEVYKKKISLREKYIIDLKDTEVEVFRIDTVRKVPEYRAKQAGWTLKGDFSRKDLKITAGLHTIAHIKPKMLSFGETLKADIKDGEDPVMVAALYIVSQMDQVAQPDKAEER